MTNLSPKPISPLTARYQVLSNGLLVDTLRNPDGSLTWHYKMPKPHSLYLLMVAIGEYGIERRTTSRGTPLNLYYYPDKRACCLEPTYRYAVEMMEFLEDEIGLPFPLAAIQPSPRRRLHLRRHGKYNSDHLWRLFYRG
jgi:aminopeptidase N